MLSSVCRQFRADDEKGPKNTLGETNDDTMKPQNVQDKLKPESVHVQDKLKPESVRDTMEKNHLTKSLESDKVRDTVTQSNIRNPWDDGDDEIMVPETVIEDIGEKDDSKSSNKQEGLNDMSKDTVADSYKKDSKPVKSSKTMSSNIRSSNRTAYNETGALPSEATVGDILSRTIRTMRQKGVKMDTVRT